MCVYVKTTISPNLMISRWNWISLLHHGVDLQLSMLYLRTSAYFCVIRRKTNNLSRLQLPTFHFYRRYFEWLAKWGRWTINWLLCSSNNLQNYFSSFKSWVRLKSCFAMTKSIVTYSWLWKSKGFCIFDQ